MQDSFYVPFEPGIGVQRVWTPKVAAVKVVGKVPEVAAVGTAAADRWWGKEGTLPSPKGLSRKPTVASQREASLLFPKLDYVRTRRPGNPPTRVALMRDARYLFAAVECVEPRMKDAHRLVPRGAKKGEVQVVPGVMPRSLIYDEHVALYLDDRHDKTTYYVLMVNVNGATRERHLTAPMGWTVLPGEDWLEMKGLRWKSAVAEKSDRWRAAFRVDLKSIGLEAKTRPTVGFNVTRGRNVDFLRHYSWADIVTVDRVPGLALGDLYLGGAGVTVRAVDWGSLEYGSNEVTLALAGGAEACEVELRVTVTDREKKHSAETRSRRVTVRAGGKAAVTAAFEYPFQYGGILVTLEVVDAASGEALYRATWPVRHHGDVHVTQPYERAGTSAPNPSPDDPEFHAKKAKFVLSRLPKFCRRTTAQGAPSDFTLMSEDRKVVFNLMQTGALRRIADWISGLFDEDNDRLIAVALLTNDDWVTVHAAPRVGMQHHMTPLSLLRLGGGHCYSRGAIGAGIVRELIDPATGRNHEAWACLVLGHVITSVKRGGDYVFIDPSMGHFFYNRGNTDFAGAKELEADPSLVTRVTRGKARLANYAKTVAQIRLDEGTIVWPAGAPPK